MSIFPFLDFNMDEPMEVEPQEEEIFKEYLWDFDKNDFKLVDGNFVVVEGLEALKIWVYKTITTTRFRYSAYSWDYGNELEQLLGKEYTAELVQSEASRYLEEALLINPYILGISDVTVSLDESTLSINFKIDSKYGEGEINV